MAQRKYCLKCDEEFWSAIPFHWDWRCPECDELLVDPRDVEEGGEKE